MSAGEVTISAPARPRSLALQIAGALIVFVAVLSAARAFTAVTPALTPEFRALLSALIVVIPITAYVVLMTRRVEQLPLSRIGLTSLATGWRALAVGFLAWLLPATAMFAALTIVGGDLRLTVPVGALLGAVLLNLVLALLLEAFPEELLFRGYLITLLSARWGGWPLIVTQAVLFAGTALLLRGYTGVLDLSLFISMGIGLGYLRLVTGTIWTPVGFHLAFQTGSQLMLGGEVVTFSSSPLAMAAALGIVPFAIGITVITTSLVTRHAAWFAPR